MATNINHMVIKGLHKQLDQVAMQQNEKKNVIKEKLSSINDATQFYTPKKIQNIMPRIPRTKEWLVGYNYGTSENIY
jgi:hypothetical protein